MAKTKKIFEVFKLTIEYEDYDFGGKKYKVTKEMFFQDEDDAKHYMWNQYRNDRQELIDYRERCNDGYDVEIEKFDEDKCEYDYVGKQGTMIRARIELVEINHFPLRYGEDGKPIL